MTPLILSLALAALTVTLVAGYVLAWTHSVMPGLSAVDDRTFVSAAQRMISEVGRPFFIVLSNIPLVAFVAAIVLAFVAAAGVPVIVLTVGALLLYIATLIFTFRVNVPLNVALLDHGDDEDPEALARTRAAFEKPWTRANTQRTWTAIASAAATIGALVLAGSAALHTA